jgi:hypothetical protein
MGLLPLTSVYSVSSGGSDSGLEVVERGLDGGLVSSVLLTAPLERDRREAVADSRLKGFLVSRAAGDNEGEFLTRSEKCSKGRMTRVYEFLICVERPGMPPYPSILPRSDHFLFFVTYSAIQTVQK